MDCGGLKGKVQNIFDKKEVFEETSEFIET